MIVGARHGGLSISEMAFPGLSMHNSVYSVYTEVRKTKHPVSTSSVGENVWLMRQ